MGSSTGVPRSPQEVLGLEMTASPAEALEAYEGVLAENRRDDRGFSQEAYALARRKDYLVYSAFMAMTDRQSDLRARLREVALVAERHILLRNNHYTARYPVGVNGEFQAYQDFMDMLRYRQDLGLEYKPDVPPVHNDPCYDVPRQPLPGMLASLERSHGWR